jgi:4-amino-4-deoxy-L-arabinose transferase-like glycosyltransferase
MWNRPWLHRLLVAGIFFAVIGPTLPWLEFTGGMEDYNVATAVETVRDGQWAIPTLNQIPRVEKPPIVHWITALGIMSSPSHLNWAARWPSLLAACLGLVAIYDLGRLLVDTRIGLIAACVGGTNLLFFKFARQASYDLNLAVWVTWTNVFLAASITSRSRWALPMAGLCLGLAIMCKGPIAVLQSVVPLAVFLAIEKRPRPAGSILLSTAVCLAVALPWPIYVITHLYGGHPLEAVRVWYYEVSLHAEALENRTGWHTYFVLTLLMTPWVVWFFGGVIDVVKHWRPSPAGLRLAILWLIIPVAVMEFFPARRDRYLLPMLGPAAVLTAWGIQRLVAHRRPQDAWMGFIHFATIGVMAIGFPLAAAFSAGLPLPQQMRLLTADGRPWLSPIPAISAAIGAAAVLTATCIIYRRRWSALVGGTVVLALLFNLVFYWGYRRGESSVGAGPVIASVTSAYPDAEVYFVRVARRRHLPELMLIYLNRDVREISDPAVVAAAARPQLLIYPPEIPSPQPPQGFVPLVQAQLDVDRYQFFVPLPARF